jgi:hypothetical protein
MHIMYIFQLAKYDVFFGIFVTVWGRFPTPRFANKQGISCMGIKFCTRVRKFVLGLKFLTKVWHFELRYEISHPGLKLRVFLNYITVFMVFKTFLRLLKSLQRHFTSAKICYTKEMVICVVVVVIFIQSCKCDLQQTTEGSFWRRLGANFEATVSS